MQGMTTSFGEPRRPAAVTPAEIRESLERILGSREFQRSRRNRNFLRYVVDETLAGRADRIKAYSIAISALDRDESFDAQTDPVVRLEASQLRRRIERYYLTDGVEDPVRIEVPKGSYVPVFSRRPVIPFPAPAPPPPSRQPSWMPWAVSAGTLASMAAAAFLAVAFVTDADPPFPPASHEGAPRLAVEPFAAVEESGDGLLSTGLDEEVARILTHYDSVAITSAGGSGQPQPPDLVLSGSVREADGRVRVTARLADARTALLLWSRSYDRTAGQGGAFEVQSTVAAAVAAHLAAPYGVLARFARAAEERGGDRQSAYACFLLTFRHREAPSPAAWAAAWDCTDQALRSDPGDAGPWALSALLLLDAGRFQDPRQDPAETLAAAERAAERALDLEPGGALPLQAASAVQFASGRSAEAVATLERALRMAPGDPELLAQLGTYLSFGGRWEEGGRLIEQALEVEDGGPGWYHFVLACRDYRRQAYGTARVHAEQAAEAGLPAARPLLAAIRARLGEPLPAMPAGEGGADGAAAELRDLNGLPLPPRLAAAILADLGLDPDSR